MHKYTAARRQGAPSNVAAALQDSSSQQGFFAGEEPVVRVRSALAGGGFAKILL
jgi:hypothetical protein